MSVTFQPGHYVVAGAEAPEFLRGKTVLSFVESLDGRYDVNMHNGGATRVLEVLDYDTHDLQGSASADDFLGRILIALAIAPHDAGMPAYRHQPNEGGAKMWEAPRHDGDLQRRLESLRELVEFCKRHDYLVVWH